MAEFHQGIGGFGENPDWYIIEDYRNVAIGSPEDNKPCHHCTDFDEDGDFRYWTVPRVVVSETQGRNDCTIVCLDCILETEKQIYK